MRDGGAYEIHVSDALGCIAVRWTGPFSADLCRDFFADLGRIPEFRLCTKLIHDGRATDLSVDSDEIFRAARLPYVKAERLAPLCIALVVDNELAYGMLRMMASMRSRDDVLIQVFRSYREAADWLDLPSHTGEVFDEF